MRPTSRIPAHEKHPRPQERERLVAGDDYLGGGVLRMSRLGQTREGCLRLFYSVAGSIIRKIRRTLEKEGLRVLEEPDLKEVLQEIGPQPACPAKNVPEDLKIVEVRRGREPDGGEVEHQVAQREEQDRGPVPAVHFSALDAAEGGRRGHVGLVGCGKKLGGPRGGAVEGVQGAHGCDVGD